MSSDMRDWLLDGLIWCAEAGILRPDTPLVVPDAAHFPSPKGATPEDTARGLLDDLLALLRWPGDHITLAPVEVLPDELRHQYGQAAEVGGTWQGNETGTLIRYDPTLMRLPATFLSVLAHEVMHDILGRHPATWDGGEETEELMTDLAVIASGMGVLQLAGAEDAGWQGYLRQDSRAHATALVIDALGQDPEKAYPHLPGRAAKALKRALAEVAASGEADELRDLLGR